MHFGPLGAGGEQEENRGAVLIETEGRSKVASSKRAANTLFPSVGGVKSSVYGTKDVVD